MLDMTGTGHGMRLRIIVLAAYRGTDGFLDHVRREGVKFIGELRRAV
jgi:hypothetical protein